MMGEQSRNKGFTNLQAIVAKSRVLDRELQVISWDADDSIM
jgi:hypothetical protein